MEEYTHRYFITIEDPENPGTAELNESRKSSKDRIYREIKEITESLKICLEEGRTGLISNHTFHFLTPENVYYVESNREINKDEETKLKKTFETCKLKVYKLEEII